MAQVETRIVELVTLDVPGLEEPAVGQLISLPVTRPPRLNQLYLRRGRQLAVGRDDEVLASEAFLKANKLDVGDSIVAIINGRRKELRIVGVAFSPEYVFQIKPGDMLPDPKHFGILWMEHEALSTAYDMEGAFNDVAISLTRGTSVEEVIRRIDILLEPYGCLGAFARKDQLSHLLLESDIQGLRAAGLIAPTIFLCVAAFLLNVVLTRLTSLQREQIAALKAFGYTNFQIAWHYMKFVLVITMVGGLVGTFGGMWLAHDFTKLFLRVYQYPELVFRVRPNVVANAVLVAGGAALAGAFGAIALAVRLPPAEAMRPEPPARYRPTILERIGLGPLVPNVARMVLRQLERHPVKTSFSLLAISMSVAIVVVGNFMRNSVDEVIQTQFYDVQRYDLSLATVEPVSIDAVTRAGEPAGRRAVRAAAVCVRCGCGRGIVRGGSASSACRRMRRCMRLKTRTGAFCRFAARRAGDLEEAGRGAGREGGRDGARRSAAGQAAGRRRADRRAARRHFRPQRVHGHRGAQSPDARRAADQRGDAHDRSAVYCRRFIASSRRRRRWPASRSGRRRSTASTTPWPRT